MLTLALAALAAPALRVRLIALAGRVTARVGAGAPLWAALGALAVALWALRERRLFGDSNILLYTAISGSKFAFPEIGASWLVDLALRAASALGRPGWGVLQAWICASGAVACGCWLAAGRLLAPAAGRGGAALIAAFALGGGVARVFAGHVEVYAFTLACAGAYLWAAAAYLRGRCGFAWVGLAFGVGLWMHLSFAFLAPSLAVLPWLGTPERRTARAAELAGGLAAAAAPLAVFVAAMAVATDGSEISALLSALGDPGAGRELWLRGWSQTPGAGTRWVVLSGPHLRYLANALFVLAPAALPLLAVLARRPRRLAASPQRIFLVVAAGGLLVYSVALRPIWGPVDWDLFSLTAALLGTLAGALLVGEVEPPLRAQLALVALCATLAFATLPLLALGVAAPRDAGPFARDALSAEGDESTEQTFDRQFERWL